MEAWPSSEEDTLELGVVGSFEKSFAMARRGVLVAHAAGAGVALGGHLRLHLLDLRAEVDDLGIFLGERRNDPGDLILEIGELLLELAVIGVIEDAGKGGRRDGAGDALLGLLFHAIRLRLDELGLHFAQTIFADAVGVRAVEEAISAGRELEFFSVTPRL